MPFSKLDRIKAKVERADKHIQDLQLALVAFFNVVENSNFLLREIDSDGNQVFKIARVPTIPPNISAIAGDALFNLRSALDHLAFQLVISNPAVTSRKGIYFPFGENETDYMASAHRRIIEEACGDAVKRFDALKPYRGGNDVLWRLCRLNNIDKHRLLLTTAMRFKHRTATWIDALQMRATMPNADPGVLSLIKYTSFGGPTEPLQVGDIIHIQHRVIKLDKELEFSFEVGIHEPKVMDCESLVETLHVMLKLVDNVIIPRFADLL